MLFVERRIISFLAILTIVGGLVHVWQHDAHLETSHSYENCLLSHLAETDVLAPLVPTLSIALILTFYFISRSVPFQRHFIFATRAPPSFFCVKS